MMASASPFLPASTRINFFLFSQCNTPRDADMIHAHLITSGHFRDPPTTTRTILSLASTPHPSLHHLALRILASSSSSTPLPTTTDPFLWNALIKSSSHGDNPQQAIATFYLMLSHVVPDRFSLSLVLKACSRIVALDEGMQLHSMMVKMGLGLDLFLQNCLLRLYCRCGFVELARMLFDRMTCRDSVSWNSMIDGYVKKGMMALARELFDEMGEGDRGPVTWNSMISGYAHLGTLEGIYMAQALFDRMDCKDVMSWNSMIDAYVKCGRMEDALDLFEKMPNRDLIAWANIIFGFMDIGRVDIARYLFDALSEKDLITWNIMMSGYVKNGCYDEALSLFHEMQATSYEAPDSTGLVIVLSAIAELGHIQEGLFIHDYILRSQLSLNGKLGVALIDMYAKCGRLEKSLHVFEVSGARSVDHWNAMISGFAIHGFGHLALHLFSEMVRLAITPDDITFIGVLSACSHSGLVDEGLACFDIMRRHYNLDPKVQHYGCIVDILARAGQLAEAGKFIEAMPIKPNDVILRSLLSGCRNQGNIDIGQKVASHMIEIESCDSSSFILLSNIYAAVGMWYNATEIRMKMREQDIRKIPGCSWIEVDGVVHEFVMGDKTHPQAREIYSLIDDFYTYISSNSDVASSGT